MKGIRIRAGLLVCPPLDPRLSPPVGVKRHPGLRCEAWLMTWGSSFYQSQKRPAACGRPRRRLRRSRRGAEARGYGRRRRAGGRARLPHSSSRRCTSLPTGLLDTTAVAHSLRDLFRHQKNATVHQATVSAVDLGAREVQFADMPALTYDYLVVGLGAIVQFFGCKGAPENAFPLYTVEDALRLRSHVVERWEAADRYPSLVEDGALNVVVVGGWSDGNRERRRPE